MSHLWVGHIPTYHRLLLDRIVQLGYRAVSLCPAPGSEPNGVQWHQFGEDSQPASSGAKQSVLRRVWSLLRRVGFRDTLGKAGLRRAVRARRNWRGLSVALSAATAEHCGSVDLVILVYPGVGFLEPGVSARFVERNFAYNWCGIWNGPTPGLRPAGPWIARWLPPETPLRAGNSRAIWVPHPDLRHTISSLGLHARVEAMPEIADLREPARRTATRDHINEAARGRRIVGLFGTISLRKGIDIMIALAKAAELAAPDLFFVAAGEFSQATCGAEYPLIEAMVANAPPNFLFFPGRIEDGPEFNALFAASDVVFAVYRDFKFQSNLLTKAACFRKPALVADGELMARCVRHYGLGEVVDPADISGGVNAIRLLLKGRDRMDNPIHPRYGEYCDENSVDRLDDLIHHALC